VDDSTTTSDSNDQELSLAEPDGLSEAERLLRARSYPPVDAPPPRVRLQFSVAGLMLTTFFVAVGLAGQGWLPASVFAGLMGLLMLLALLWGRVHAPEHPAVPWIWGGITLAYLVAAVVALVHRATQ
jgi:hypothetical protein